MDEVLETERAALCRERRRASSGIASRCVRDTWRARWCLGGRRVAVQRPRARSVGGRELRLPSWRECCESRSQWRPRMGRGEHRLLRTSGAGMRLSSLGPHWHGEDLNRLNILDGLTTNRGDSPGWVCNANYISRLEAHRLAGLYSHHPSR